MRFREMIPKRPDANPDLEARVAPRSIDLLSNYFTLNNSTPTIYQYAVSFDPPVESRAMRFTMLESHKGVFGAHCSSFLSFCLCFPFLFRRALCL